MRQLPWEEFKKTLLELPKNGEAVHVQRAGTIINEELFVKSHIHVIDQYPKKEVMTDAEKLARLRIAKPFYDRLNAYYLLKINF